MRKVILLSLAVFLAISCENIKPEPQLPKVNFTPCVQDKQPSKLKSSESSSNVKVEFTAEGIQITYNDFEVTCDFTTVNVTHTFENGVLNITQQATPNQAKCICYTDVSYTISGISQNKVNVIFINGVQVYCINENNTLQGTKWKLAGIVDVQTGELKELEPKDCEKCYTLTFDTCYKIISSDTNEGLKSLGKNYFVTRSAGNELCGHYIADYVSHSFQPIFLGGTKACEWGDGWLYADPFWKNAIQSFSLQENELRLYYNDYNDIEKYLLFKPLEL